MIIIFALNPYEGKGLIFLICGGCSPSFIGIILSLITYNKEEKHEFFRRFYQIKRIGVFWRLFIIFIFPVIYAASIFFDLLTGGSMPQMTILKNVIQNPISILPLLFISFLFSGPFPEEFGWRGFALIPLLKRLGFTKASVLLGIIWALWHLPLFFMPQMWHGQKGFATAAFFCFFLQVIGLTMIMSLVFIKTNYSTLSAMMMHLTCNLTLNLLEKISDNVLITSFLLIFFTGIAICIYNGNLSKPWLGFERFLEENR